MPVKTDRIKIMNTYTKKQYNLQCRVFFLILTLQLTPSLCYVNMYMNNVLVMSNKQYVLVERAAAYMSIIKNNELCWLSSNSHVSC